MAPATLSKNTELTAPETAGELGVTLSTICRWIGQGIKALGGSRVKLRARRLGGQWRIHRRDIDQFLAKLNQQSDSG